jgi:nucleoside-diphosphate-sugar epimerase
VQNGISIDINADIFAQGFDSLSATFLRNGMLAAIRGATEDTVRDIANNIGNGFVYAHPSVQRMTAALIVLMDRGTNAREGGNGNEAPMTALNAVQAMIQTYSQNMPELKAVVQEPSASRSVILITGSTGGLGSHILVTLLRDERVTKVYALNRPSKINTLLRQRSVFEDRCAHEILSSLMLMRRKEGWMADCWIQPNLCFWTRTPRKIDSACQRVFTMRYTLFGATSNVLNTFPFQIRRTVTVIIHNAWRLDFNLGLSAFEPNVRATRRLLDLALMSNHCHTIRFFFTSSISVARAWPRDHGPYPEEPQADARWSLGSGYGEGKYVSERLLVAAAQQGIHTTSFRIGQIAGAVVTGAWSLTDWVPILLKSSVALRCLPDTGHVRIIYMLAACVDKVFRLRLGCPPITLVSLLLTLRSVKGHQISPSICNTPAQ